MTHGVRRERYVHDILEGDDRSAVIPHILPPFLLYLMRLHEVVRVAEEVACL